MQNKGIVKFIAVLLFLVCCFYLSFSFVTRHYESKAAAMGEEAGAEYLDSINNEKVYMGVYSLKQCREMEIGLGLDLKGGMNVILEVSVPDVVDVLADHKTDAAYKKAMELAKKEEETGRLRFSVREVLETGRQRPSPRRHLCYPADEGQGQHTVKRLRSGGCHPC